ncbi:hypothetical protein TNCV_1251671 [Trichonephila clavipes]|nr:hypothetical protein TNCV_1251671 [Trichonephila clavipes]
MELNTVSHREVKANCRHPHCAHRFQLLSSRGKSRLQISTLRSRVELTDSNCFRREVLLIHLLAHQIEGLQILKQEVLLTKGNVDFVAKEVITGRNVPRIDDKYEVLFVNMYSIYDRRKDIKNMTEESFISIDPWELIIGGFASD